eukprot:gene13021-13150_t
MKHCVMFVSVQADVDGIEAIEHYCNSTQSFQRLAYAQGIAAAATNHSYQDCLEVLIPLVENISKDHEPEIRSVAVQQIVGLGVALHQKDAERSLRDLEATLLVCAQQCALDDEEEVSQAAVLAFQQLVQLLPSARATAASKRAVDRLESRGTDDGTLAAVRLLAHTVSCWTPEALRRHVPRYINRWTNHRDFSVREYSSDHASASTGNLLSSHLAGRLQQRNRSMSSLTGQRPAATTAQIMTKHPMHSSLITDGLLGAEQCMDLLTADSSHWVKVAALSGLGPFLLKLPGCQLGQLLLGRFTGMAGSSVVIYEISLALSCAQHYGQLAARLGPGRWQDMRDAWHALQSSRDPAVLCELVAGLPGLVAALGPAITGAELLPALATLLQNHLTWISSKLVAVMAQLLEALPASGQDMLLKVLGQLVSPLGERSRSWRLRRELALQLGRMAAATGPEAVTESLWPAAMVLCCDPVAAVRTAAAGQVGPLIAVLPATALLQSRSVDGGELRGNGVVYDAEASAGRGLSPELDALRHAGRLMGVAVGVGTGKEASLDAASNRCRDNDVSAAATAADDVGSPVQDVGLASHPALSQQRSAPYPVQQPNKYKAHKSAGDLIKVAAAAASGTPVAAGMQITEQQQAHRRIKRQSSSSSMPARLMPLSAAATPHGSSSSLSDGADYGLPDAANAAPHEYLPCLLQVFGCSRHHQQRQLFVTLVMSLLSGCPDMLSQAQQGQLLDRLEVLATDAVSGVRYAVAAAMADVQQQAAQLLQAGTSTAAGLDSQDRVQQQPDQGLQTCACLNGSTGQEAVQPRLDSYHNYVKQLAECSRIRYQQCQQCLGEKAAAPHRDGQGKLGQGTAPQEGGGGGAADACGQASGTPPDASYDEAPESDAIAAVATDAEPQWLLKLANCQQFERLMLAALSPSRV